MWPRARLWGARCGEAGPAESSQPFEGGSVEGESRFQAGPRDQHLFIFGFGVFRPSTLLGGDRLQAPGGEVGEGSGFSTCGPLPSSGPTRLTGRCPQSGSPCDDAHAFGAIDQIGRGRFSNATRILVCSVLTDGHCASAGLHFHDSQNFERATPKRRQRRAGPTKSR